MKGRWGVMKEYCEYEALELQKMSFYENYSVSQNIFRFMGKLKGGSLAQHIDVLLSINEEDS